MWRDDGEPTNGFDAVLAGEFHAGRELCRGELFILGILTFDESCGDLKSGEGDGEDGVCDADLHGIFSGVTEESMKELCGAVRQQGVSFCGRCREPSAGGEL